MNITNFMDLHNAILFLRSDARFSVWDTNNINEYHGDTDPIVLFNRLVNWSPLNSYKCPSENEILKINQNDFNVFLSKKDEQIKIDKYKNDMAVKAAFINYKANNPNASFLDYINYLENIVIN